jgi:hypothetical protein
MHEYLPITPKGETISKEDFTMENKLKQIYTEWATNEVAVATKEGKEFAEGAFESFAAMVISMSKHYGTSWCVLVVNDSRSMRAFSKNTMVWEHKNPIADEETRSILYSAVWCRVVAETWSSLTGLDFGKEVEISSIIS